MTLKRRLAAILAADVAGYSRLIGANEEGTLARLKTHRSELIDPEIAAHKGRLVKTTGDGLLVEFASVVDALRCATEMHGTRSPRMLLSDMTITWSAAAAKAVMGDDDHASAIVACEVHQEPLHVGAGDGIEVAGRLVGQDQQRIIGERGGDGNSLALSA